MIKQSGLLNPAVTKALQDAFQYTRRAAHGGASSIADVGAKMIGMSPKDSLKDLYLKPFQKLQQGAESTVADKALGYMRPQGLLGAARENPEAAGAALAHVAPVALGAGALANHALKQSAYLDGIKAACARRGIDPAPFLKQAQQGPVPPVAPTTPAPAAPAVDPRAGIKARQAREAGTFQDSANPYVMQRDEHENAVSDWTPGSHTNPGYIADPYAGRNFWNRYSAGWQYLGNKTMGALDLRTPEVQEMVRNQLLARQQDVARAHYSELAKGQEQSSDISRLPAEYAQQMFRRDPRTQAQTEMVRQMTGEPLVGPARQMMKERGYVEQPGGVGYSAPYMQYAQYGSMAPRRTPGFAAGIDNGQLPAPYNPALATSGLLPVAGASGASPAPAVSPFTQKV